MKGGENMNKLVQKVSTGIGLSIVGMMAFTGIALAASGYSLFGGASYVSPGNNSSRAVQLTSNLSNTSASDDYSGIDFTVPSGMKFSDITNLSTDYNFTHNSCGGGSPRFQINVTTPSGTKNAFVYIGPPPNYTNCPMNVWTNTGNLATPASFVDTTQLGGTFYDTFATADVTYGSYPVASIQLVADAGWFFNDKIQTVLVDNVMINNKTYGFEPKDNDQDKDHKDNHDGNNQNGKSTGN